MYRRMQNSWNWIENAHELRTFSQSILFIDLQNIKRTFSADPSLKTWRQQLMNNSRDAVDLNSCLRSVNAFVAALLFRFATHKTTFLIGRVTAAENASQLGSNYKTFLWIRMTILLLHNDPPLRWESYILHQRLSQNLSSSSHFLARKCLKNFAFVKIKPPRGFRMCSSIDRSDVKAADHHVLAAAPPRADEKSEIFRSLHREALNLIKTS